MAEPSQPPPSVPQVRDRRPTLRSLLPENMQARVLGGIALLMTLVILFSGRKSAPERKAPPAPSAQAVDPNVSRIQEYRSGIEAATRQLTSEETQLAQAKAALERTGAAVATGENRPPSSGAWLPVPGYPPLGEDLPIVYKDRSKVDQSLFASNISLSYRPPPQATATQQTPASPTEARVEPNTVALKKEAGLHRLFEGTVIETVLTNRLDSSFAGPVNCLVTTDIYSADRAVVLIPQGSRVLGEVRRLDNLGEQRLAVFFHRLIRPDGYSVSLDKFQGLNQIGETGLRDQVNHHYLQIFGTSLAIGAVAGLAQANTRYGIDETAADAYQQGVASSLAQSSMHVLDRYLNVLPTFTIREGHRVKVYLSQDLELPPYDPDKTF